MPAIIDRDKLDRIRLAAGYRKRVNMYEALGRINEAPTLNVRLSQRSKWSDSEIEDIAKLLSCKPADFTISDAQLDTNSIASLSSAKSDLVVHDREYFDDIYNNFGRGDFLMISSGDGFIESSQKPFYKKVLHAIDNELSVFYLYPATNGNTRSRLDFINILENILRDLGPSPAGNVRAFHLSRNSTSFHAHNSRFVLIGRLEQNKMIVSCVMIFLNIGDGYWVEMNHPVRDDFLIELANSIEPVEDRPLEIWSRDWQLPDIIKDNYRTSFSNSHADHSYDVVRKLSQTSESVINLVKRFTDDLSARRPSRQNQPISWLDVGCEDGTNTQQASLALRKAGYSPYLTALETSKQNNPMPILEHSVFLNGLDWSIERYIEKIDPIEKFDLITLFHSLYVIDLTILAKLSRALTRDGSLLIMTSHLQDNVINIITSIIDSYIIENKKITPTAYRNKIIFTDPLRNYGEDVLAACIDMFGEEATITSKRNKSMPADAILEKDGSLNYIGRSVVEFFTHRIIRPDQTLFDNVANELNKVNTSGRLPINEIDIRINKIDMGNDSKKSFFNFKIK